MSIPYVYPKSRHQRQIAPPKYKTYRTYKPYLRTEFQGQCIYCRMPDSLLGEAQFGADHYRPKSLFPALSAEYTNLFYCCNACNRYKGDFWPTNDAAKHFLPNPVDHLMFAHLRYKHAIVEPASPAGEFTIDLLQLNNKSMVEYREDVLHSIDVNEKFLNDLTQAERAIQTKFTRGAATAEQRDTSLKKVQELQKKTLRTLARFQGIFRIP